MPSARFERPKNLRSGLARGLPESLRPPCGAIARTGGQRAQRVLNHERLLRLREPDHVRPRRLQDTAALPLAIAAHNGRKLFGKR